MNDPALIAIVVVAAVLAIGFAVAARAKNAESKDVAVAENRHSYGTLDSSKVGQFSEYPGAFAWDIVGESHYQDAPATVIKKQG